MELSHSSRTGLTLKKIQGFNTTENKYTQFWKHIDADGVGVGPNYPTKAEALVDTTDYAIRAGWLITE